MSFSTCLFETSSEIETSIVRLDQGKAKDKLKLVTRLALNTQEAAAPNLYLINLSILLRSELTNLNFRECSINISENLLVPLNFSDKLAKLHFNVTTQRRFKWLMYISEVVCYSVFRSELFQKDLDTFISNEEVYCCNNCLLRIGIQPLTQ